MKSSRSSKLLMQLQANLQNMEPYSGKLAAPFYSKGEKI
nr:MAG TPA: hypothetical protein [Caudoviricetes sp.]